MVVGGTNEGFEWVVVKWWETTYNDDSSGKENFNLLLCYKDDRTAGRTKGVRHTCPEPSKGRGEARYFAPKGTQGKGGVGRKSKAEELSAEDSLGSDRSARPEVRGAQDKGDESGIQ